MEYVYPILIFIIMGIIFGILLVVISKVFAVKVDKRVSDITESLPGANCGACGFAGCADYADAIVNKNAQMNLCLPGGANSASAISKIMGAQVSVADKKIPVIHCNGNCNNTSNAFNFEGIQTCASAKRFYGSDMKCLFGCIGLGDCASACPENAIKIKDNLATFCYDICISCGKCSKICPNGLIEMRSEKKKVDVLCSSQDKGKAAVDACKSSCIGCGKCVKVCRFDAIAVENNHAVIDYDKCKSCGLCVKECPRECIVNLRKPKQEVK